MKDIGITGTGRIRTRRPKPRSATIHFIASDAFVTAVRASAHRNGVPFQRELDKWVHQRLALL